VAGYSVEAEVVGRSMRSCLRLLLWKGLTCDWFEAAKGGLGFWMGPAQGLWIREGGSLA